MGEEEEEEGGKKKSAGRGSRQGREHEEEVKGEDEGCVI